jgi:cytochrome P450
MNNTCPISALSDTFLLSNEELAETLKKSRREDPVYYLPEINFWAVTRFHDIKQVLGDSETFSAEITLDPLKPFSPEALQLLKDRNFAARPTLSNNTGENHARIRRNAQIAFSPGRIKKLQPYIRQLVNEAVDSFENDKRADLVAQMVYELPALVLFRLLGVPEEDVKTIKNWADDRLLLTFGKLDHDAQLQATAQLADYWDYCVELVNNRIESPRDDLPSDMLATRGGDDSIMTVEDIYNVVFGLLLAGHETTTNASASAIYTLLRHPASWRSIVDDRSAIPNAIEEILRYRPSVVAWRRRTRKPVVLSGVSIPKGSKLLLFLASGNRDEDVFENGEAFDIHRKEARKHIAFGFGAHFCLGAPLARYELQIILEELSGRLPGLRLAPDNEYVPIDTVQFRGPKTLLVEWD